MAIRIKCDLLAPLKLLWPGIYLDTDEMIPWALREWIARIGPMPFYIPEGMLGMSESNKRGEAPF